jgi:uncharacterized membrane protein
MNLLFKIVLPAALIFSACNNDSLQTTTVDTDSTFTDTINYATNTDSLLMANNTMRPPDGIYQGILPCDGCKGLEHTVLFNKDLTFQLQEAKIDKKAAPAFLTTGTWKPTDSVVWLYKEGVVQARYTWGGDTLLYMDAKTGRRYPLRKLTSALENDVWKAKGAAGIEFFGVGNEPFWNVEIDEQKSIAFHLAEWSAPQQFKAVKPTVQGDSTVYNTANDSATLRVVVYNNFCSDGMSDFIYKNAVKVLYNGQTYRGCGIRY